MEHVTAVKRVSPLLAFALTMLTLPGSAAALNPPVLTSVGHVQYHPTAEWSLPQWVEAWSVGVATKPDVASDGQFFEENRVVFDTVRTTDTSWTYESRLNPGTYYLQVRGWDNACLHNDFTTECGVVTSNTLRLVLPPRPPRYTATLRSIHVGAIRVPGSSRTWTYHGDTLRATLRNAAATPSERRRYRVCYQQFRRVCRTRTLRGSTTDAVRVDMHGPWFRCLHSRQIRFFWIVNGRTIARRTAWIYECV